MRKSKKFSSLGWKEKIEYIWDYYKLHIIVAVTAVSLISFITYKYFHKPEYRFSCIIMNDAGNEKLKNHVRSFYSEHTGVKKEDIFVDTDYTLTFLEEEQMNWPDEATGVKYAQLQTTHAADIAVMDYDSIPWAVKVGFLTPVDEILSDETLKQLSDCLVYQDDNSLSENGNTAEANSKISADSTASESEDLNSSAAKGSTASASEDLNSSAAADSTASESENLTAFAAGGSDSAADSSKAFPQSTAADSGAFSSEKSGLKNGESRNTNGTAIGIDISNTDFYRDYAQNYERAVLCFPNVSKHRKEAADFTRFVFEEMLSGNGSDQG